MHMLMHTCMQEIQLMMHSGWVDSVDSFGLVSRNIPMVLELGNCGGGQVPTPMLIGIRNDEWYGSLSITLTLSSKLCDKCTGVICNKNAVCKDGLCSCTEGYEPIEVGG